MKIGLRYRRFASILLAALLLLAWPTAALAQSGAHSLTDIRAAWTRYKPTHTGSFFVQQPNTKTPYSLGKVEQGLLDDGLKMANFMRFLAYLPDDLVLDTALNESAQHGAVLMAANGVLSHNPKKPVDMASAFYQAGAAACASSNLAYTSWDATLAKSVLLYMEDSDSNNIAQVGHRRWILNPSLRKIGFGMAKSAAGYYSAMKIMDESGGAATSAFTAWPSPGVFPLEMMGDGLVPWSITLDPARYSNRSIGNIRVRLTELTGEKRSWSFPGQGHFSVCAQGYGVPFCVVFKPDDLAALQQGQRFRVQVEGLNDAASGAPQSISYEVEFGSLTPMAGENRSILTNAEVAASRLTLRDAPGGKAIGTLTRGERVFRLQERGAWTRLQRADGTGGYAATSYLKEMYTSTGAIKSQKLILREKASSDAVVLGALGPADRFEVVEMVNDWAKIEMSHGTVAYIARRYIKPVQS